MNCPVCEKRMRADPDKQGYHDGETMHRICAMKESGEFALIEKLFQMQDEPHLDPTTAMADLIGNLGHFAVEHSKRKRGDKRINFEESVRRGLNYYREECL